MPDDPSEDTTTAEDPSPAVRPAMPDDKYRIGRELGRGGMGEVRVAHDQVLGREVAIKRLLDNRAGSPLEARFLREARVQGRLDHPSIPPVYELGYDRDGCPYIVMKRLVGTTLGDILKSETTLYPRERLLRAFVDVCLAIELAHSRGVIHRDIKPANIMLGEFGEVYVLDWGVAKVLGDSDVAGDEGLGLGSEDSTRAGAVVGTPSYMSPEQREGSLDVDARADVFALGRLLAEILAGKKIRSGEDGRPSSHALVPVPPELDELCLSATHLDREQRIQRARLLADRVQAYLDGDRDLAQRRTLAQAHLDRALAAMEEARSDDTERTAMREASRALALDPTLVAAADLVGRLMLEPPRELPPEVVERIADQEDTAARLLARQGVVAYAAYLAFLPAAAMIGIRSAWWIVAFVAISIVLAAAAWYVVVTKTPRAALTFAWPAYTTVIGNAVMVAIFTRIFSTFVIAPGVAAITAMLMFRSPAFQRHWVFVTACLSLGVLVPWVLEATGVIEATYHFTGMTFELHSTVLAFTEGPTLFGLVAYTVLSVVFVAAQSRIYARTQRSLDERVHLQAWRLRQLVPA